MRQFFKISALIITLLIGITYSDSVQAEMNPRVKAVLIMAGYGTVSGALLGTASLAFGTDGRSVAKGASIGLYTGILFGSYVVLSHYMQKQRRLNPQPAEPYQQEEGLESGGLFGAKLDWDEYHELQRQSLSEQSKLSFLSNKKARRAGPDFYVNVLSFQF